MSYLDTLPLDLKKEMEKYKERMKLNDNILQDFCWICIGGIMNENQAEIQKIIDSFNNLLFENKSLSQFELSEYVGQNLYFPLLNFNDKDIITDEFILKFTNFICQYYPSEVNVRCVNQRLNNLNCPFRLVEEYINDREYKIYMVKIYL